MAKKHTPRSTDVVSSVDTTGVAPGPHSRLEGVTPIFDVDRERTGADPTQDKTIIERFEEKAVGAGTVEYQEANSESPVVEHNQAADVPYAPAEGTTDTSGTDETAATAVGHDPVHAEQTDTLDTSDTGGDPNPDLTSPGTVDDATSLTGAESTTAAASQERADASDEASDGRRAALNKVKGGVPSLLRLADHNSVEIPSGAKKAEIVAALDAAGVDAPEDGVVPDDAPQADEADSEAGNDAPSGDQS